MRKIKRFVRRNMTTRMDDRRSLYLFNETHSNRRRVWERKDSIGNDEIGFWLIFIVNNFSSFCQIKTQKSGKIFFHPLEWRSINSILVIEFICLCACVSKQSFHFARWFSGFSFLSFLPSVCIGLGRSIVFTSFLLSAIWMCQSEFRSNEKDKGKIEKIFSFSFRFSLVTLNAVKRCLLFLVSDFVARDTIDRNWPFQLNFDRRRYFFVLKAICCSNRDASHWIAFAFVIR